MFTSIPSTKLFHTICLCLFWLNGLQAQDWLVRHYTIDEGLPHNIGYDILQDEKGYIWIGTDNGLSRFDGKEFLNFDQEDGLGGDYIITLSHGKEAGLYAASYRKGITHIEYPKVTLTDYNRSPTLNITGFHPEILFFEEEIFLIENRDNSRKQMLIWDDGEINSEAKLTYENNELVLKKMPNMVNGRKET